ncbi:hypothetical protein DIPPA_09125 [Diplonema papillatum]|nr:hypothetical protein DIPPA_09125 [Diplonema papillatum]
MASVPEDERSAPRRPACSWAVVKDEDGSIWYEKRATGERQRDKPAEVAAVKKDPRTCFECRSKDGKVFYKNSATGGKAWEGPNPTALLHTFLNYRPVKQSTS